MATRYDWWGYVKGMIKRYPELASEYEELKEPSISANLSGMPHGGGISDPTAAVALRQLPGVKQKEYDAVRSALDDLKAEEHYLVMMDIIKAVYWKKEKTLYGAAGEWSESTVKKWHRAFVYSVARHYGLID